MPTHNTRNNSVPMAAVKNTSLNCRSICGGPLFRRRLERTRSIFTTGATAGTVWSAARRYDRAVEIGPGETRTETRPWLVKVIGFTTEMDELMAASDMVMGKPGGLTTWESFNRGLVWAVVNPIPGQEERNALHLLEEGAGIWCNNLHTAAFKVDNLLSDEPRLRAMSAESRRLARPDPASITVERGLQLIPKAAT